MLCYFTFFRQPWRGGWELRDLGWSTEKLIKLKGKRHLRKFLNLKNVLYRIAWLFKCIYLQKILFWRLQWIFNLTASVLRDWVWVQVTVCLEYPFFPLWLHLGSLVCSHVPKTSLDKIGLNLFVHGVLWFNNYRMHYWLMSSVSRIDSRFTMMPPG